MWVRNQVIEGGSVALDTTLQARSDWAALHGLLAHHQVNYDANQFFRRGDWVCFKDRDTTYRTMTERKFG